MLQNIRQVRRKETSLSHPSTSLHFMQIVRFIQEYQHSRMTYSINLNAGVVQSALPLKESSTEEHMELIKDVPYIQSEHYDSSHTFTEDQDNRSSSDQNFTDEEEESSSEQIQAYQRKFVVLADDDFNSEDFQFVAGKTSQKQSVATFPHSSTIHSSSQENKEPNFEQELEIYKLQQTAYFSQAPQLERIEVTLKYVSEQRGDEKADKQNEQKTESLGVRQAKVSKKAMFLNKIEKERSRKEKFQGVRPRQISKRLV